jgi:predicted small lipoprotein YifL
MSLFTLLLSACGQKGPLYLSEKKSEIQVQKTTSSTPAQENQQSQADKK